MFWSSKKRLHSKIKALETEIGKLKNVSEITTGSFTSKKNSESTPQHSQMLQFILDSIPHRIFWKDKDLNYMGCNIGFANDAGFNSHDEIIGKSDFDLVKKTKAESRRKDDFEVISSGKPKINYLESQKSKEKNEIRWSEISKVPLYNNNENVVGVLGAYTDVTDRVLAEQQLQQQNEEINAQNEEFAVINEELNSINEKLLESEKKFKAITEQSLVAIAILCEGKFKYYNKAFEQFTTSSPETIENWKPMQFVDQIYPEDRANVLDQINKKLNDESDYIENYKFRYVQKTGDIIWIDLFSRPIKYEEKNAILITMQDITQKLEIQNDLLLFKQLADNSSQGMAITNLEGEIIYGNKVFLNYFGITVKTEQLKQNLNTNHKLENIRQFENEILPQIFETGYWSGEIGILDKSANKEIPTIQNFYLIRDNNNLSYIACTIIDISLQKNAEKEILEAKQKAEESDRLKSAFLANMSHEIRTPMNGILGFANLLEDKDLENNLRDEYITIINNNSKTLLNLIDDIIDIAKIEAGELKINITDCDINRLIYDLQRLFEETVMDDKKEIKLEVSIPKNNDLIIGTDVFRLRQIFSNLISNAIKFTEKGQIEFGYNLRNNWIDLFVKDTGIGLKPEQTKVIFDRFRQVEGSLSRAYSGTGLGLTITKHLVEILGGKIGVESKYGKGTKFQFSLPLKKINTLQKDKEETIPKITKNPNWSQHTILVAEDEEINFMYIKELLKKTKANIVHKINGAEAVEYIKSGNSASIILMDMKMPVMNGYEATTKIKEIKAEIPVVAVTAYAMGDDRTKAIKAGCDDYVAKPIKKSLFFQTLQKFLA